MEPANLELYTTTELINEVMRRQTFLGVVVHSQEDCKNASWGPERMFKIHFNSNLDVFQAGRLLETVAEYIEHNCHPDAR